MRRTRRLATALVLAASGWLVQGCDPGTGPTDDKCAGIISDPSVPTSCAVVEGRVIDQLYQPVRAANVRIECFGPEAGGCGATPGVTDDDGRYRLMVHDLRQEGAEGFVMVHAHDWPSGQRASSDTVPVVFAPMSTAYRVYSIDLRLVAGSPSGP